MMLEKEMTVKKLSVLQKQNVLNREFANVCNWTILGKIKLNVFFELGKNLTELNITYEQKNKAIYGRIPLLLS